MSWLQFDMCVLCQFEASQAIIGLREVDFEEMVILVFVGIRSDAMQRQFRTLPAYSYIWKGVS